VSRRGERAHGEANVPKHPHLRRDGKGVRLGESEYSTDGSIVGNKRTFVKDLDSGVEGKPTKLRYIEVQVSPTSYTYQAEASIDGGPWTVIAEGKVTKVK
jgi:hypothetical protein